MSCKIGEINMWSMVHYPIIPGYRWKGLVTTINACTDGQARLQRALAEMIRTYSRKVWRRRKRKRSEGEDVEKRNA